jgi:hypothetical protein
VAAKRSPILGYNHNVRYRGIVFHVQTEDSGIVNPHVFSHLFHGGVIISTRKLVYDPDATEDVVKSLMQAQHKAVMKDLKNRFFDEKIDQYLAGTEGLLPRERAGGGGGGGASAPPVSSPDETAPSPKFDDPTPPSVPMPVATESSEPVIELVDGGQTIPVPVVHDVLPSGMPGALDVPAARAATERVTPQDLQQPPVASALGRTDISEAMSSIQVADAELEAAGLVEMSEAAQVHSPAPPSTPPPPGARVETGAGVQPERPGQYSVRRGSGPIEKLERPASTQPGGSGAPRPPIPKPTPPSNKMPQPGVPPRPPTQPLAAQHPPGAGPHIAVPRPPVPPGQGGVVRPTPSSVPRINPPSGAAMPRPGTTPPPRARAPSGGGVVVSRPPVIVGGPSKAVGTPAGQGKVRRAKDTDGGIGGDLISERSLDEVILAYLSEDTSDE